MQIATVLVQNWKFKFHTKIGNAFISPCLHNQTVGDVDNVVVFLQLHRQYKSSESHYTSSVHHHTDSTGENQRRVRLWLPAFLFKTGRSSTHNAINVLNLVLLTWPSMNQTPQNRSHDGTLNRLMHTFQRPTAVSGKWVALNYLNTSFVCITGLVSAVATVSSR